MRLPKFFASFRIRLLILTLLGVLPAFGLVVYMNLEQRRVETSRVREAAIATARLSAANQQKFTEHTRQLLATLSQFSFLTLTTNEALAHEHLSNLRKLAPDYLNFGLIETNGLLFSSAQSFTGAVSLADRPYFRRVLETQKFSAGNFQIGRLSGLAGLNFGYPVLNDEGKLERVLYASLRLPLLSEALAHIPLPPESSITVLDRSGTVLARSPDPEPYVGKVWANAPVMARAFEVKEGVFEMQGADGVSRLYAVSTVYDGDAPSLFVTVGIPLKVCYERANRNLMRNLFFLVPVALIILISGIYFANRSFLRPVNALAAAAEKLAAGNLEARVGNVHGSQELSQLGRTLDETAHRLQERQREIERANEEIRAINADLDRRVKDRTTALEVANKDLEAFSYSVSHDLRAPLRHLSGFVDLLGRKADSLDPDGRRFLEFIGTAAKQMSRLVNDLLNFSRSARTPMRVVPVDLSAVVEKVKKSFAAELKGRAVEWEIAVLPTVQADESLMDVVMTNLIGNAIKYTRPRNPARVTIGTQPDGADHVIFVRDNGVGFDMQYATKLFGVFQRFHSEEEFEGSGVGLATVHRIIARLGGRTWAEAKENEGATIYFSLPRSAERPAETGPGPTPAAKP
jgi:signal transduction histidine kinase